MSDEGILRHECPCLYGDAGPAKATGGPNSPHRRHRQRSGTHEFANVARNKLRHEWRTITYALEQFRLSFEAVCPLTLDTHVAAVSLAEDNGLAFDDALIVASAIEAGCDTLYTEDMQHNRAIGGLTIRNPFIERTP
jgi:predicted nucleic acid-binding protein